MSNDGKRVIQKRSYKIYSLNYQAMKDQQIETVINEIDEHLKKPLTTRDLDDL